MRRLLPCLALGAIVFGFLCLTSGGGPAGRYAEEAWAQVTTYRPLSQLATVTTFNPGTTLLPLSINTGGGWISRGAYIPNVFGGISTTGHTHSAYLTSFNWAFLATSGHQHSQYLTTYTDTTGSGLTTTDLAAYQYVSTTNLAARGYITWAGVSTTGHVHAQYLTTYTDTTGAADWANPGPIGTGAPSSGKFTDLTATNSFTAPSFVSSAADGGHYMTIYNGVAYTGLTTTGVWRDSASGPERYNGSAWESMRNASWITTGTFDVARNPGLSTIGHSHSIYLTTLRGAMTPSHVFTKCTTISTPGGAVSWLVEAWNYVVNILKIMVYPSGGNGRLDSNWEICTGTSGDLCASVNPIGTNDLISTTNQKTTLSVMQNSTIPAGYMVRWRINTGTIGTFAQVLGCIDYTFGTTP